jgi:glycosyltransferase involved in cell wall biosynthesis
MKVLMYGWEFPPKISGGLGVACYSIVKELAKKNVEVSVVLPQSVDNFIDKKVSIIGCDTLEEVADTDYLKKLFNIDIKHVNFLTLLNPYISSSAYNQRLLLLKNKLKQGQLTTDEAVELKNITSGAEGSSSGSHVHHLTGKYDSNLFSDVLQYAVLAGALASVTEHDVIHVHDWLTVLAGVEAKKISHKPLVFHIHALEHDRSGDAIDVRIFAIEKYGMEQADKIVAVSEYTKNMIVQKYGIPPEKIEVIYNGTDIPDLPEEKLVKNKHYKMVLFLGRLAHQKGPQYFLQVAKKILERRKNVHFVVAGTGGLMPELVHYVANHRLGRYIHFTGFLDKRRVERLYRLADVYVMPSVSEPFGLSCLEALSHDVPVVISKQSGVSEVLSHAVRVDFWDIDEMANKILALLDYRALRKVSLENKSKELPKLTWEKTVLLLMRLYNLLIKKGEQK